MDDGAQSKNKQSFWQKLFGSGTMHAQEDVTEEEIISMVKEGHEQGVLLASEAEMIHNIFAFDDKEAKDIMTHRTNMIAVDGEISYTDMVAFMIETGKSRYPVYLEDVDHMIGVLHIKDAFAFSQRNEVFRSSIKDIKGLLREVDFIPETMKLNTLFTKMQSEKNHLVIVIDEYGQTAGIVAMEDILEEIVGNIEDEHDEEELLIREEGDGRIIMDGLTEIEDVKERLHISLETDDFDTLNGLLTSLIGRVLNDDETEIVRAFGYKFEVTLVEDQMIKEVIITNDEDREKED